MRTKLAAAALLVALGAGGVAMAPTADAATAPAHAAHLIAAPAAVPGFYAGGSWPLYQSNGPVVTMNLAQSPDGTLYGSASFSGAVGTVISGSVDGTSIYFVVSWSNGALGRYTGTLGPDRRLSGYTFDVNHPSVQAGWHTNRTF
ncbi:hypothetical protein AB0M29_17780 [Streptomyces sp. NPDC051976]|uniref:hypothetical protein n=1 Tax=Streptomyces sp. NPDC051976 TaxID=3154947 RepID=UPI00341A64B2